MPVTLIAIYGAFYGIRAMPEKIEAFTFLSSDSGLDLPVFEFSSLYLGQVSTKTEKKTCI